MNTYICVFMQILRLLKIQSLLRVVQLQVKTFNCVISEANLYSVNYSDIILLYAECN